MEVWTKKGIFNLRSKLIRRTMGDITGFRVVQQHGSQHPHVAVSARGSDDTLYDVHLTLRDLDKILQFVRRNENDFKSDRDPLVFNDKP